MESFLELGIAIMESKLVSVIIPIYNAEKYLCQCLDSIIAQTHRHLEIICVDDGSTDKSGEIAQSYAKKDSRIYYIKQANLGAGVARNVGLDRAKGDFVMIFDADDFMRPFAISTLLQRALETNAQIIIAQSEELKDGNLSPISFALRLDLVPKKDIFNYKDLGEHTFRFCNGWAWDKLYKRDFIESYALRFEHIKSPADDLYFVLISIVRADAISICQKVLFTHRKHKDSIESNRDKMPCLFLNSIFVLQSELKRLGIFTQIERGFASWCLEFALWHLGTLSKEAHLELFVVLKKAFYDLGLAYMPKCYFDKNHYAQMQYILKVPLWLHKLNASKSCDIKQIFRIRLGRRKSIVTLFGKTLYEKHYDKA